MGARRVVATMVDKRGMEVVFIPGFEGWSWGLNGEMREWELGWDEDVDGLVRRLDGLGLVGKELALATMPGARHWHFRKEGEKGCLELTWWPDQEQVWLSIHGNRDGEWIEGVVGELLRNC